MKRKILGAFALVGAMAISASASASLQSLSDMFVFGDSLSDGGNSGIVSRAATGGSVTFPPAPYYNGQYSNGPVAVEYLWQSYNGGASFAPSLAGGTNYAIGGATSGLENYNSFSSSTGPLAPAYNQLGTNWQINAFSAQLAGGRTFDPATSLFVVWLFPNDVFLANSNSSLPGTASGGLGGPLPFPGGLSNLNNVSALISNGVTNIAYTVSALAQMGAQHFLVPNMPDLGKTPDILGTAAAPGLSLLSQVFNFYLAQAMGQLDAALTSADIVQFDTMGAFNEVIGNPGAYGIKNVTQQCIQNYAACAADNFQWLFWDSVHPTTYAHRFLATEFRAAIPEPETIFLLAVGLLGIVVFRRKRAA